MAMPTRLNLKHRVYTTYHADLSTASSTYIGVVSRGKVVSAQVTQIAAITTADNALSVKIGTNASGTAITGMTATQAFSTSVAGFTTSLAAPTALMHVSAGDNIELITDGASSGTSPGVWTVVVQEY